MLMRQNTDYIVIHCSASLPSEDIGVAEIRALHAGPKGTFVKWAGKDIECFGWSDVGYHWVIKRDGTTEVGRPKMNVGAHAYGYNSVSVGICLAGGAHGVCDYTRRQWRSLEELVSLMKDMYPLAQVIGHRGLPKVNKSCPNFDAGTWWLDV